MKRLLTVLAAVSLFAACGSSSPSVLPTPSQATSTIQAVIFSGNFTALTQAGSTAQLTASGVFADGTMRDVTSTCVGWQSDDPLVLSVSSGGLLTAQRSSGSATISTTCQSVSARGVVTVNPPPTQPPGLPPSTTCTAGPYTWDSNPDVLRCREPSGRFAASACCGH